MNMVIIDTDILSMFAKADAIDLLIELFKDKIVITPKIRDEISVPLEYGYDFPLRVLSRIRTMPLNKSAVGEYEKLQEELSLGKGELEAIAYCKTEKCMFVTNDLKARTFAKSKGIFVISLQSILKALWKKRILTKKEVRKLFNKIIQVDNLSVEKNIMNTIFEE